MTHVSFAPSRFLEATDTDAREGDIVFTSTAHQPLYIGHRVDVVSAVPPAFQDRLIFNGDLMRVRLSDQTTFPPDYVAAFLRNPLGKEQIRRCDRGVSSHVYPEDIAGIVIPLPPRNLAGTIRRKARTAEAHRWRYSEKVRAAVERLEEDVAAALDDGRRQPRGNQGAPPSSNFGP